METELREILTEIYRGQKENNDEAVERILLLFNVVGQSEQLKAFAEMVANDDLSYFKDSETLLKDFESL